MQAHGVSPTGELFGETNSYRCWTEGVGTASQMLFNQGKRQPLDKPCITFWREYNGIYDRNYRTHTCKCQYVYISISSLDYISIVYIILHLISQQKQHSPTYAFIFSPSKMLLANRNGKCHSRTSSTRQVSKPKPISAKKMATTELPRPDS